MGIKALYMPVPVRIQPVRAARNQRGIGIGKCAQLSGNSWENTDSKATIASHSARLSKNLGRQANTGIESEETGR
jgi:hypothetical protein